MTLATRARSLPIPLWFLLAPVVFGAVTGSVAGQQSLTAVNSLRGLPGVVVAYDLFGDFAALGIDSADIRTTLEVELRKARIPVLVLSPQIPRDEMLRRGMLSFRLTALRTGVGTAVSFMLELTQVALLARGDTPVTATTWEAQPTLGWLGPAADSRNIVLGSVRQLVAEFINAYLTTNPK